MGNIVQYYYYIDGQRITPYGNDKILSWEIYNDEIFGRYKLEKPIVLKEREDIELIETIRDTRPTETIYFKIERDHYGTVSICYQG